jgi:hypothetical protein
MKNATLLLILIITSSVVMSQTENKDKSIPQKPSSEQPHLNTKEELNIFFWEDFDSGLMPPIGWTIDSGETPRTWTAGSVDIYPPVSGSYFALCRYDESYVPEGQDEKLFTPVLDLQGLSDAKLGFWFMFSRYWGITPHNNYDLQVLISTDGGIQFGDTIWTELSTDTSAWASWDWVWAEVDLTSYVGMANVQLCFRYVGFDGADAAIENVEISFLTSIGQFETNSIKLFPNPAQDVLFIDGSDERTVRMYDASGKMVVAKHLLPSENQLSISGLSKGVYIVTVESQNNIPIGTFRVIVE